MREPGKNKYNQILMYNIKPQVFVHWGFSNYKERKRGKSRYQLDNRCCFNKERSQTN